MNPAPGRSWIVGITGLPGAGKGEAAKTLAAIFGVAVVDVDRIGHAVLEDAEIQARLRARFGDAIRTDDGAIDRAALAARAFRDPEALAALEAVVHPPMIRCVEEEVRRARERGAVAIDAALLYPMGLHRLCDRVWIVEADPRIRLERVAARGWDREELRRRERRQIPIVRASPPPWTELRNEGTLAAWRETVAKAWEMMRDA